MKIAKERGLSNPLFHHLSFLLKTIADHPALLKLSFSTLFQSMIPNEYWIDEEGVINVISCLMKVTISQRVEILQWVEIIYLRIANKSHFQSLYTIFFHMLTYDSLAVISSSILYRMTRKEEIKSHRIKKLYHLYRQYGSTPSGRAVYLLLSLYKKYHPDTIALPFSNLFSSSDSQLLSLFKYNKEMYLTLQKVIKNNNNDEENEELTSNLNILQCQRLLITFDKNKMEKKKKEKKRKNKIIPPLQTLADSHSSKMISIEEIGSFYHLAQNINKIRMPSQVVSALTNPYYKYYLSLHTPDDVIFRFNSWLKYVMEEEFFLKQNLFANSSTKRTLLSHIRKFCSFNSQKIIDHEDFLLKYLSIWNGFDYQKEIFALISSIPIGSFDFKICDHLRRLFMIMDVMFKSKVINTYSKLLRYWLIINRVKANSTPIIHQLVDHVNQISTFALFCDQDHPLIFHSIFSFYQIVKTIYTKSSIPMVIVPPNGIVYRCLFSASPFPIDQMAIILSDYRNELSQFKVEIKKRINQEKNANAAAPSSPSLSSSSLNAKYKVQSDSINTYLQDWCNSLYQGNVEPSKFLILSQFLLSPLYYFILLLFILIFIIDYFYH